MTPRWVLERFAEQWMTVEEPQAHPGCVWLPPALSLRESASGGQAML
jgi:hypothetical protein